MFGLPQGSILCPLLFNIYICDMAFDIIEYDIANYADDSTPYTSSCSLDTVIKKRYFTGSERTI